MRNSALSWLSCSQFVLSDSTMQCPSRALYQEGGRACVGIVVVYCVWGFCMHVSLILLTYPVSSRSCLIAFRYEQREKKKSTFILLPLYFPALVLCT